MGHPDPEGADRTGYAIVKYGIILVIVIVVLFFIARYLIPLLSGDEGENDGPELPDAPDQTLVLTDPPAPATIR